MQLRLPEIFCDAKRAVEDSLQGNKVILGRYKSSLATLCSVIYYNITEVENVESVCSLDLVLSYRERVITKYDKFETLNKTQTLKVLSTKGDTIWPSIMTTKVWDGEYPSSVALNLETGVVYLLYLKLGAIGLVEFSVLTESQIDAVKESLNDIRPYTIKLDENAMFKVLSEIEGTRCLSDTLYIEIDCGVPFRVYSNLPVLEV